MKIARSVFAFSGAYGILVLAPMLFREAEISLSPMGAINHPEFYYGFICLALVFQFLFVLIALDPLRYRPAMLIAAAEKFAFFLPVMVLERDGRIEQASPFFIGGLIDGFFALVFIAVWIATGKGGAPSHRR